MANFGPLPERWSPYVLSVVRIVIGFLLLFHGTQKLFNYPPTDREPAALLSLMGLAGVLEFGGGLLFLLGFLTRPLGFLLSGLMAVAYFMAHAPGGFLPIVNRGELAVAYCFIFLYFAAAGGGRWSVDALLERRRQAGR